MKMRTLAVGVALVLVPDNMQAQPAHDQNIVGMWCSDYIEEIQGAVALNVTSVENGEFEGSHVWMGERPYVRDVVGTVEQPSAKRDYISLVYNGHDTVKYDLAYLGTELVGFGQGLQSGIFWTVLMTKELCSTTKTPSR